VEEAQAVSDKSWSILIPTIRRPDSEIWVTFNPELDTDPTYERFILDPPEDSHVEFINWRDNPWFPDVLNRERLHLKRLQEEGKVAPGTYENVWEGKCRPAVDGAIFHLEIANAQAEGRIKAVPYDPDIPCQTVWDLGWNDQTSIIICQKKNSEIAIVDYIEDNHRTLDSYVKELESKPYRSHFKQECPHGTSLTVWEGLLRSSPSTRLKYPSQRQDRFLVSVISIRPVLNGLSTVSRDIEELSIPPRTNQERPCTMSIHTARTPFAC
jgi:hypothetical protein